MVKFDEAVKALMLMKNGSSNVNVDSSKTKSFKRAIRSRDIAARLKNANTILLNHCVILNDKDSTHLEKKSL